MIFFPLSIPIRTRKNSIFRYSLFFLINHRQELPTSILKQGYLRDFPVHQLPYTLHPTPHTPLPYHPTPPSPTCN
ncbi:hypothetical protein [Microcystis aeruginosa]|uniref:hypothetical protein n=1 Tax=Microcystis aeruginosa TaxID=1126 RepID=UPI000A4153BA|nr:hypothetical protein [Microcystis aeruginosa]